MPVFNCRTTVAEAVASILNQTLEDWELVLIDDGSRDGTAEIVRRFHDQRIRLIEGKINRGLPARLNEIVQESRGAFIARMDGDDVAYPRRLQLQVEFLRNHPNVDLVAGAIAIFDGHGAALGVRRGPADHEAICAHPYSGFLLAHATWMGQREWFQSHPYREDANRMEDWDLLFRTYGQSRFANLQEVVLGYREDPLSFRKLVSARWNKSRFVLEYARKNSAFLSALIEVNSQTSKFFLDAFALGTGLNHRVLRHRIPPITPAEAETWREVLHAAHIAAWQHTEERKSVPA